MINARAARAAYSNLWHALLTRYVQCGVCGRVAEPGGGVHVLERAGWSWRLGIGCLRWRCPECAW